MEKQRRRARRWLSQRPHVPLLELGHGTVIAGPAATATALNRFFGGSLSEAAMVTVVDAELHRQRADGAKE